jgi:hypothetical protein
MYSPQLRDRKNNQKKKQGKLTEYRGRRISAISEHPSLHSHWCEDFKSFINFNIFSQLNISMFLLLENESYRHIHSESLVGRVP